jgi:putative alpha-1,2-mannosidase
MVRNVMDNLYSAGPAGLCGNEDMGQMSAWFIFSAMGFYPVTPGQNTYAIGSPVFSKVIIHLDKTYNNGDKFVIEARNNSTKNKYIQSAMLNGKILNKPWFSHSEIKNGGTLIFQMGPEPNKEWGSSPEAVPPSMTRQMPVL